MIAKAKYNFAFNGKSYIAGDEVEVDEKTLAILANEVEIEEKKLKKELKNKMLKGTHKNK